MIAGFALTIWPLIGLIFYRTLTLPHALIATILGGYLLLPTNTALDLPLIPALDKYSIPALTALVLTAFALRKRDQTWSVLTGWLPANRVSFVLVFVFVASGLISVLANRDPQLVGVDLVISMSLKDGISIALKYALLLVPLLLARKVLATREGQHIIVVWLVISMTVYSFLALWEIRMSPQLNLKLYGFFPQSWDQHKRGGGFRPVVFLQHGLFLGTMLMTATLVAFGLARASVGRNRLIWAGCALILMITLVLAKVLGALLIVLVLLPIILFLPRRIQLLAAGVITILVLSYPVLRSAGVVPLDRILEFAESINPNRATSLEYRIDNEEILLARAMERPVLGWGGWGRNRVFDEFGNDLSTTDGAWIIELGVGGWVRYVAYFGLLTWGTLVLFVRARDRFPPDSVILAMAMTGVIVDLLPNAGNSPVIWMVAGALLGRIEPQAEILDGSPGVAPSPNGQTSELAFARRDGSAEHLYARNIPKTGVASSAAGSGARGALKFRREFPGTRYGKRPDGGRTRS